MSELRVKSTKDFAKFSKALKAAGKTELRKELNKGLRAAAKPMLPVARKAGSEALPGDLGKRVGKTRFRVQVRTGARTAGVRIVADGRNVAAKTSNATGRIRHPVFADSSKTRREWTWESQQVGHKGWFDKAMAAEAPKVRKELLAAMKRVADKVERGAR